MKTYLVSQLEKELQEINPSVVIRENPNRPGLSNVMLNGVDICVGLPSNVLQEEHTPDYVYRFPNDIVAPMKTYPEAKEISIKVLNNLKNEQFAQEFFDTSYLKDDEAIEYNG